MLKKSFTGWNTGKAAIIKPVVLIWLAGYLGGVFAGEYRIAQPVAPGVDPANFRFAVAGHAYGSHRGENQGLYPAFVRRFNQLLQSPAGKELAFLVLAGDVVRRSSPEAWQAVRNTLKQWPLPTYLVLGNHDNTPEGRRFAAERAGSTYYYFDLGNNRFIFLDTQQDSRRISGEQLQFFRRLVEQPEAPRRIFVFCHELIWNGHRRYRGIASNGRSRFNRMGVSNFWKDLYPLCQSRPDHQFYFIAGDVGGRDDAIAAFYDRVGNVTFIATGMGQVVDENFLLVRVTADSVRFKLVPLSPEVQLPPLEAYNVRNLTHMR
ncbi:MAG: hypothetical protein D6715_00730, partial [Calditrichaeota bacterium]